MDSKYRKDLMSIMLAPENLIAVGEMLQLNEEWLGEVLDLYIWKPLEVYAKQRNMLFGKECRYGKEGGAWMYKKEWKHYGLFIWTDRKYDWNDMYIGVSWYEEPNKRNNIYKKDYQKLNCLSENPCDGWPYGFEYLHNNFRNWGYNNTAEIVQGEVLNYIKKKFDEMIAEIDELQLRMP